MKDLKRLAIVLCVCSLTFIPGFAANLLAIDLTLNIPVELINMPKSITSGYISCSAHPADRVHNVMSTQRIAEGEFRFDIRANYSGMARIVMKNSTPNPPSGLGYKCVLFLQDTARPAEKTTLYAPAGTILYNYPVDTSKPVRYSVSGIR